MKIFLVYFAETVLFRDLQMPYLFQETRMEHIQTISEPILTGIKMDYFHMALIRQIHVLLVLYMVNQKITVS